MSLQTEFVPICWIINKYIIIVAIGSFMSELSCKLGGVYVLKL